MSLDRYKLKDALHEEAENVFERLFKALRDARLRSIELRLPSWLSVDTGEKEAAISAGSAIIRIRRSTLLYCVPRYGVAEHIGTALPDWILARTHRAICRASKWVARIEEMIERTDERRNAQAAEAFRDLQSLVVEKAICED